MRNASGSRPAAVIVAALAALFIQSACAREPDWISPKGRVSFNFLPGWTRVTNTDAALAANKLGPGNIPVAGCQVSITSYPKRDIDTQPLLNQLTAMTKPDTIKSALSPASRLLSFSNSTMADDVLIADSEFDGPSRGTIVKSWTREFSLLSKGEMNSYFVSCDAATPVLPDTNAEITTFLASMKITRE